jgi:hypothetical protein
MPAHYDLAAADRGCAAMAVSDLARAVQGGTAAARGHLISALTASSILICQDATDYRRSDRQFMESLSPSHPSARGQHGYIKQIRICNDAP